MVEAVVGAVRNLLIKLGNSGSQTMCVGFFHEVELPEELKEEEK